MPEKIQPYTDWLGVDSGNKSPSHYDLLGLKPFEQDDKRILKEYVQRSQKIRRLQVRQPQLVTQVLNELAIACDCLTDPILKHAYDADLRRQLGIKPPPPRKRPPPLSEYYQRRRKTSAVSPPPLPAKRGQKKYRWLLYGLIIVATLLTGMAAICAGAAYFVFTTLSR